MSVIDEVKSRIDIVDFVGEHVPLKKAGRSYKANCPFHSERTPSFIVSPERQTWHCFGACSEGGDVFNFLMKREGLEFAEALRILAERVGVPLSDRRAHQEEDAQRNRLVEANETAATYYHNALLNSRGGAPAREYLASRGLDTETIEAFQVGYAPDSWEGLRSHLIGRGFSEVELVNAGLLVESDRGGYDRFRGRLIFPIRDDFGHAVGFGARRIETLGLDATEGLDAKYINTPQTSMFDKGGLLYALDRAKEAIKRERTVIVVEGYMDVIAAHQHARTNVVASMGTALTERQIKLLERLRSRILLAMDTDAAGIEATLRALREAGEAGAVRAGLRTVHPSDVSEDEFGRLAQEWSKDALKRAAVNFAVVPLAGKDPDEMIRAADGDWEQAIDAARPFTEYVFDVVAQRKDLTQPGQRAELLQELLPFVRLINEPTYQAHYVQRLASKARVSEHVVWAELQRKRSRRQSRETPAAIAAQLYREPQEEFCLALLLRHDHLRADGEALPPELFVLAEHRAIFLAWLSARDIDALRTALPVELHARLDMVLARELPFLEGPRLQEALQDCVARIGLRRLTQAKHASAAALTEPEVQEHMSAALEEALILKGTRSGSHTLDSPSQSDGPALDLATTLVDDEEMGRRLHRAHNALPVETPPPNEEAS